MADPCCFEGGRLEGQKPEGLGPLFPGLDRSSLVCAQSALTVAPVYPDLTLPHLEQNPILWPQDPPCRGPVPAQHWSFQAEIFSDNCKSSSG